ncbi:MAG: co-chaperone DjlA [Pseudomonadales bacterium]|nr:co-chaperone DjlA [Pseudomonadales bacterium]
MSWMGKILGGGLGFVFAGPVGAVLGATLGHHALDAGASSGSGVLSSLENKQSIYFAATFSMLAKLAKADGMITQHEIDVIDRVMRENLRLDERARNFAIAIFNAAKNDDQSFEDFAKQFYDEFGHSKEILISVVELLLLVAFADGQLHSNEEELILRAVKIFGLETQYQQMKGRFIQAPDDLEHCYGVLGAAQGDDFREIKKKYRKLAMEYHPDRIHAKGMPPELALAAEEKFKEIQHAYDQVEKHASRTPTG